MKVTEEGMQYCGSCKKHTHHIPKLTLSLEGKRLCSVCRVSNYVSATEETCKHIKREGESCRLNNNCTYPNCTH